MADNDNPKVCDLVLEGGVTSALVFAGLVATLARSYRFKRVGGTSAGAVAAAAAAIAEATRQVNPSVGSMPFAAIADLPRLLSATGTGGTLLLRLFQPTAKTGRGLAIVVAFMRARGKAGGAGGPCSLWRGAMAAALASVLRFPAGALLGLLPGALVLVGASAVPSLLMAAVGLLLLLTLPFVGAVAWALVATLAAMVRNHFGLCSGLRVEPASDPGLTDLLHGFYNDLAGRAAADAPVRFAELWRAGTGPAPQRQVDLQVITTCVSTQRPLRIPNDPGQRDPLADFYFDKQEWSDFFPAPVMTWLLEHPRVNAGVVVHARDGTALQPLPAPQDLPVLVAVRLSLSFPGLLSAVPMYRIEPARRAPGLPGQVVFTARKVYFSDGGITSNLPVHLFDAPIPTYPTFGVDLRDLSLASSPASAGRRQAVWMEGDHDAPPLAQPDFEQRGGLRSALGFVGAIIDSARTWRDSLQRELPGYAERIVNVGLKPFEGGLNLTMAPATIRRLGRLGRAAALRLKRDFSAPRTGGRFNRWDRHRWIRLRSTLAAAQRLAREIEAARHAPPGQPDITLRDPFEQVGDRPTPEPRLADAAASAEARRLIETLGQLAAPGLADLAADAPEPAARLRMAPPL